MPATIGDLWRTTMLFGGSIGSFTDLSESDEVHIATTVRNSNHARERDFLLAVSKIKYFKGECVGMGLGCFGRRWEQRVLRDKGDDLVEFTVFVDALPELMDRSELWSLFKRVGFVTDVFIPLKRSKLGTRFGFIRFDCKEVAEMEIRVFNGLMVKEMKLRVKWAVYGRNFGKMITSMVRDVRALSSCMHKLGQMHTRAEICSFDDWRKPSIGGIEGSVTVISQGLGGRVQRPHATLTNLPSRDLYQGICSLSLEDEMLMDCSKIDGAAGAEEQDRLDVAAIEAELWFGGSGDELTLIQESMSCFDVPRLVDKDPDDSVEGDLGSNGAPKEEDEQTSLGIIFKGLLCPEENCKGQPGKEKKYGIVCCSHKGSALRQSERIKCNKENMLEIIQTTFWK
ncbi:hypothetical protein Dimus_021927 [Dionaea muscipula]